MWLSIAYIKITVNKTIVAEIASNNSEDLLTVDSFKFRKVYESKSGNVTWCCMLKSYLAKIN
jgi:phage-related protein